MKKTVQRNAFFSLLSLMLASLLVVTSGCDDKRKTGRRSDVLIMGTSGDFPPFEFYKTDQNSNQMIGFDVELAGRMCEYLGYTLEIKDIDFPGLIPALQSGRIDFVMAGLTPTREREKVIDFSTIYYKTSNVLITRINDDFNKLKQFKGKKIGVQLGSTQEQFGRFWAAKNPGVELAPLNRVNDVVQELISKRIDGVILENTVAVAYALQNPGAYAIEPLEDRQDGMAIAFVKKSVLTKDFDKALEHLREIGYLDKLIQKWFGAANNGGAS